MDDPIMSFDGNGQPDFLSLINAEAEKVEPTNIVPPNPPDEQLPSLVFPESLPSLSEKPKREQHLKASTFTEPTLPIDWLSQPVQDYIRTVTESYGCPQDYVVASCLVTAGIAAGKKVKLLTNPYTNYSDDFVCLVGKPSRNKTGPLKEVTMPLREHDKADFAKYSEAKAAYDQNKREDKNFSGEQPIFHQRVVGDSTSESRNTLLAQGDMIIIVADELKSFVDSFGRYSKGGNGSAAELSQVLSIWSNVSFTINRKSEDTKLVDEKGYEIEVIGEGYLRQRRLQFDEVVDFFRSVENHDDHDNQRNGENVSPEELTHDVAIEDFNSGKLDFHNLRDSFSTITGFHSEKVPCKICSRASPTSQR